MPRHGGTGRAGLGPHPYLHPRPGLHFGLASGLPFTSCDLSHIHADISVHMSKLHSLHPKYFVLGHLWAVGLLECILEVWPTASGSQWPSQSLGLGSAIGTKSPNVA